MTRLLRSGRLDLADESGISMIEMIVTVFIAAVIFGTTVAAFGSFLNHNTLAERQAQAVDAARIAVDRVLVQARSAMTPGVSSNEQLVFDATSYDITYLVPRSNITIANNPRGLVWVRYCLNVSTLTNETLYAQTATYNSSAQAVPPSSGGGSGTKPCPGSAWPTTRIVASNLVNQFQSPAVPLFITPADSSGNVTNVGVHAVVDANTSKLPKATTLRSSVTLRNLNRRPNAVLTCQAQTNGHAICDASGSTDVDAQSLYFAWKMDGSTLAGETSYRLDKASLTSASVHTFEVAVTDTSGASNTADASVTMP